MSTILIVEDQAIVREPIEAALAHEGFTTLCARDGTEALGILQREAPDLILLDLVLPRVDGLAVLSHIHASPKLRAIPVIVLSAHSEREQIMAAAKLGVTAYLLKAHFSLRQLIEKIRDALGEGQAEGEAGEKAEQTDRPGAAAA